LRDKLAQVRDLQVAQAQALLDRDGERLEALDRERMTLQAGIVPLDSSGLQGTARAEADELVRVIRESQDALIAAAHQARDAIAAELRDMSSGRTALEGYRPTAKTNSRYLDSQS
jgi:hypothetical protein